MSRVNLTEEGKEKVGMDYILTNDENIEYRGNNIIVKSTRTGKTFILKPEDIKDID
ncbi:MAG: hypothetical protein WC541_04455 [Dehalococcoidia bacterium]